MGERGRFDWLVEIGGAAVPAAAACFAAFKLAPVFETGAQAAMGSGSAAAFALALAAMRLVPPEPRQHVIADFTVELIEEVDELLLDQLHEEPLLLEDLSEEPDEALLLEDRLGAPAADSRVAQLFASSAMPTPGQLRARIDRHQAGEPQSPVEPIAAQLPDASDALYAALAELKRSLR